MPSEPQCPPHVPKHPAGPAYTSLFRGPGDSWATRERGHGGCLGACVPEMDRLSRKPTSNTYCDPEWVTSPLWASLPFCATVGNP